MTAAIVCNGEFPRKEYPLWLLRNADVVVCCDAGAGLRGVLREGLEPDAIVGDLDSVSSAVLKRFAGRIVKVEEQDDNDLAKAFGWLRDAHPEIDEIHILGAGGGNEAHTLGNLSYLMLWERENSFYEMGIRVDMVSDYSTAFAFSEPCELHVGQGRKVSLFSCDPALRIHSEGLHWPTDDVPLDIWRNASLNRADTDVISLVPDRKSPVLVIFD